MLIDTHAHLGDEQIVGNADEIINSFKDFDIETVIEIGADVDSSIVAIEFARKYDNIYATVGIHPHVTNTFTLADIDKIKELALSESKVKAIGEIGLDYHYDYDRDKQKMLFTLQLELAHELRMPVVIHLRDAYEEMYHLLKDNADKLSDGVLLHCYSGSKEMLEQFAFLDAYYAFGGAITFKNNNRAEVIRAVPRDRLLIETDSPYMSPTPYRGQLNTPLNLRIVAERMAQDLDIKYEELAELTTANAKRFFNL